MEYAEPVDYGWLRDRPDHRDFGPRHPAVRKLLRTLKKSKGTQADVPGQVDWREYCPPVLDQRPLATCTAHACVALVQFFERRATGRVLSPSRLFVYKNARRLLHRSGDQGATIRSTLQAIVRFGLPPECHWPYDASRLDSEPDGFLYSYHQEFAALKYLRLDERNCLGDQTLQRLKAFLAAGFACVLGLPMNTRLATEAEISYPTLCDAVRAGHAMMAVGYDDQRRIRSDRGALLLHNSWGTGWGEHGYGWLPYHYVRQALAVDIWTLILPSWLASGEFQRPRI